MNLRNRIADLSMIWKQASVIFPYFEHGNVNWDTAYQDFLLKIMDAQTDIEFHLLLTEFLNLFGDGHTDYTPPKALLDQIGYLPFSLHYIQDSYIIQSITPAHEEYMNAQIISMNGVPFLELIERIKRYCYHVGNYVPRYSLHLMLPFFLKSRENTVVTTTGSFTFDLHQTKPDNLKTKQLDVPENYLPVKYGKLDIRLFEEGILYIKMDDFMYSKAVAEVQAAITKTPAIKGIILDLRENIGGMTMYGARVAELFISGVFHGCKKRTRSMTGIGLSSASQIAHWTDEIAARQIAAGHSTHQEIEKSRQLMENSYFDNYMDSYGTESHTAIYSGQCVILTSRHTVSAAEDFIAMFRTNQRALILGTETCGTTGTPFLQKLSCGGRMRICSVAYQLLDGTAFIGCGIKPDILCEASFSDYADGYDRVLDNALQILRNQ